MARGRTLAEFQQDFPDEASCAAFLLKAPLAQRIRVPCMWQVPRRRTEEPSAPVGVSRLRAPNLDYGRHGDAPLQVAADGVVLDRAFDGDPFQRHVGAAIRGPAWRDLQDGLAAVAKAAAIHGRSEPRSARRRRRGRSGGNSIPGWRHVLRAWQRWENPYRRRH